MNVYRDAMGFPEDISRHAELITARTPHIRGEEVRKHALVVPFIQLLGDDVSDPREVQPECAADFATKTRGQLEKIDYAAWEDGRAAIFVECKARTAELADHDGPLSRHFNAKPCVPVVLSTNGIRSKAFTDLEQPNGMDPRPLLDVHLTALQAAEIDALPRFHKVDFSTEQVFGLAEEIADHSALTKVPAVQLRGPSDSFLRFMMSETRRFGRARSRELERVRPILKKAIHATIPDGATRSSEAADRWGSPGDWGADRRTELIAVGSGRGTGEPGPIATSRENGTGGRREAAGRARAWRGRHDGRGGRALELSRDAHRRAASEGDSGVSRLAPAVRRASGERAKVVSALQHPEGTLLGGLLARESRRGAGGRGSGFVGPLAARAWNAPGATRAWGAMAFECEAAPGAEDTQRSEDPL